MQKLLGTWSRLVPMWLLLTALARGADAPPAGPSSPPPEAKPAAPEAKPAAPETAAPPAGAVAPAPPVPDDENSCILCHANLTEKDQERFFVTAKDFADDIHWQKGLRCQDCHGGDPTVLEIKAHQAKDNFRAVKTPADIPEFCGECHADAAYIKRFNPTLRTDQLAQYKTSGHGQRLKAGDMQVATCISCHDKPHGTAQDKAPHGIRAIDDLESPVYRTRLAKTCAHCHADEKLMANRTYHDHPLGHDQYAKWRESVHGKALMDKGDLSAPTCNNCHGSHGALPPGVGSVANACGACHGKVASLFANTRMRHKFEQEQLPGCATCHHAHDIVQPTDSLLGMGTGTVCSRCHEPGKVGRFGAPVLGAETAGTLRAGLDQLKQGIAKANETLDEAGRLGMEVQETRFELRKADDSLTNARSLIHTFQVKPVETALATGEKVVATVQQKADEALWQHTARRIWLAASLAPILLVIALLLLYIRSLPVPKS